MDPFHSALICSSPHMLVLTLTERDRWMTENLHKNSQFLLPATAQHIFASYKCSRGQQVWLKQFRLIALLHLTHGAIHSYTKE